MNKEIEKPTIERAESHKLAHEYAQELKKKFHGVEITEMKVKPVGDINKEVKLLYKGVSLIHIPPRANSLFGFRLWLDGEIHAGKIYNEEQKAELTKRVEVAIDNINNDLAQERSKQADKEQKAKK